MSKEKYESYQKIVAIEKDILEVAQKFVDISKQVQEITHLPEEHENVQAFIRQDQPNWKLETKSYHGNMRG